MLWMMAALDGVPTAMPELVVDGDTGLVLEDACAALPGAILLPQLNLSWFDPSCPWTRMKQNNCQAVATERGKTRDLVRRHMAEVERE